MERCLLQIANITITVWRKFLIVNSQVTSMHRRLLTCYHLEKPNMYQLVARQWQRVGVDVSSISSIIGGKAVWKVSEVIAVVTSDDTSFF